MANKIFILKKENIFPNIGIFIKLNKYFWKKTLKKINRKIKNEPEKSRIISDFPYDSDYGTCLNDTSYVGINPKRFAFKPSKDYEEAVKFVNKFFSCDIVKDILTYENYDLREMLSEWFAYFMVNPLQDLNLIEEIIECEKPSEVCFLDKCSIFWKITNLIYKKNNIELSHILPWYYSKFRGLINSVMNKFNVDIRFWDFPGVKRKEFVKTDYQNNREKILIGAFDDYYLERLYPLIEQLKKEKILVLATNINTQEKLKAKGIKYASFWDFLSKEDIESTKRQKKEIKKKLKNIDKLSENFEYGGLNFLKAIKKEVKSFLFINILSLLYYTKATENMIDKGIKIILLLDNVIPTNSALSRVAKEKKVKSIVIQHGLFSDSVKRGLTPFFSDKIAVFGEKMKEHLKMYPEYNGKIVVTGAIRLDKYAEKIRTKNGRYIILATQAFEGLSGKKERELMVKTSISAIKKFPNKKLIIRFHPRESEEDIKKAENIIQQSKTKNVILETELETEKLLQNCEALITVNSTLLLDAMILKKPVILLNLINRPEIINCVKSGSVIGAYKEEDLIKSIKKIQNKKVREELNKNAQKFLETNCYKLNGKASERVAKIVKDAIKT